MHKIDIICLGEPLVEFNQVPDGSFRLGFGGDVSNVAIAAARHGASAGLITRIGQDMFGESLCELWQRENVDTSGVITSSEGETGIYFVTHDASGHHFSYRRKNSAASQITRDELPIPYIESSKVFYASGISLAVSESMRSATIHAAERSKNAGGLFAFDPNLRTALWPLEEARNRTHEVMKSCDIALPGFEDARELTGKDNASSIVEFYHLLGCKIVVLTLGKDGVLVSAEGQLHHLDGHVVNAVDATGAGDCFNGVFLAEFVNSRDVLKSARAANYAASVSTTKFGAV